MSLSEVNKKLELGIFLINKLGMLEHSQASCYNLISKTIYSSRQLYETLKLCCEAILGPLLDHTLLTIKN